MKKRQFLSIITASIILISLSLSGIAQSTKKGSKEKEPKTAIWRAQGNSICTSYDLPKKETSKLTKSYVKIRQEVADKNKKVSKRDDKQAYEANAFKNMETGKSKLKKEIDKILKDDQATEALLVFGSFSSRWDSYQKALLDLDLKKEKLAAASKSLTEYIKLYLQARKIATDSGDRFSGRTATELKNNLDTALSSILNEKQMKEWSTATQRKTRSN